MSDKNCIDESCSGNHCILITLYFIYVYILQIIYDKLPYMLYILPKSVTP